MTEDLVERIRKQANKGYESLYNLFIDNQLAPAELIEIIRQVKKKDIISEHYPYDKKMDRAGYENEKRKLQIELLKCQNWIKENGKRVILVFEGRDAAGKGGTIKRFTEHMNPRGARVVALEKPTAKRSWAVVFSKIYQSFSHNW